MKLPEVRNRVRQDVLDILPTSQIFPDEAVDRAFLAALEDFSRFVPVELFYDITVERNNLTESFNTTTLALTKSYTLNLSYRLLEYNSVVVSVGATIYALNTDYFVDYINGTITVPAASTIADGATVVVQYYLSRYLFDLASLTDLRAINSVEVLYGRMPQEFSGFSLMGTILAVTTNGERSQIQIPNGFHVVVHYDARHTPPDDNNDGTLQETYVEIVIKGAIANLLYAKAISIELSQTTNLIGEQADLADLDPYFTEGEAFFTALVADLASARASLVQATTAANAAVAQATADITNVGTDITTAQGDLTAVDAAITTAMTILTNGLAFVDTEVAADITTAFGLMSSGSESALTAAIADLVAGLTKIDTEVESDLAFVPTMITDMITALGNVSTNLATALADIAAIATPLGLSAADRVSGEAIINVVNIGSDPVGYYAKFGELAKTIADVNVQAGEAVVKVAAEQNQQAVSYINAAKEYIDSALSRLKLNAEYVSAANQYITIADNRVKQSANYLAGADTRLKLLDGYIADAREYISIADERLKQATTNLEAAKTRIALLQELITVSEQYVHIAGGFHQGYVGVAETGVQAVQSKVALIQAALARFAENRQVSDSLLQLTERIRLEATRRYQDFQTLIADRNQTRRSGSIVATKQLGNYDYSYSGN